MGLLKAVGEVEDIRFPTLGKGLPVFAFMSTSFVPTNPKPFGEFGDVGEAVVLLPLKISTFGGGDLGLSGFVAMLPALV